MTTPVRDAASPISATGPLKRRGVLLGAAAAAGVAVIAAKALPSGAADAAVVAPPKAPDAGGGYRLTEHVKRYYETTCA